MNADKVRKKARKKFLNLRKSNAWITVPTFLIALTICAVMFMALVNLVTQLAMESRLYGAVEHVQSLAQIYEDNGEQALKMFDKQRINYVVFAEDGSKLHWNGKMTYSTKSGYYERVMGNSLVSVSFGRTGNYLYEDTERPLLKLTKEQTVCFDCRELNKFIASIRLLSKEDQSDELTADDDEVLIVDDALALGLPLWIAQDVNNGTERLVMRSELVFRVSDIGMVLVLLAALLCVFLFVSCSMLIDIIGGFANQSRTNKLLFTDMATKGKNRAWFLYKGEQVLRKRYALKNRFAVADLSFVKYQSFCVCHSLTEGEQLLGRIFRQLQSQMRKREVCAHMADGSFALLLQYTDEAALTKRIREMIEGLQTLDAQHILAFHAGIAPVNRTGIRPKDRSEIDIEQDFSNAGNACATLDGGDETAVALFDQKLVEEQKWVDTVTECQKKALDAEEFLVFYQPKYDPQTNRLRGAEALVRWQSPEHGFVPPGRFVPIFENNGFITELDHYMLEHVARDQRRWLDAGFSCVPVSVNVSRAHFIESDLAEQIRDIVDAAGTPHELIEIELTESAFFDDKKAMIRTIEKLKEYGFAVSMDDFGSGYSSLNSLKDMPLDVLKLDAEFFRGEEAGTDRGEIVVSEAIRLAKSLHMRTVAEGVEIREQVDFLASQGCDMIQGYYFAKPMPGAEYEERMRTGVDTEHGAAPAAEAALAAESV